MPDVDILPVNASVFCHLLQHKRHSTSYAAAYSAIDLLYIITASLLPFGGVSFMK